jgi:lambda repressor-like predicted transcriptional regulator
MARRTGEYCASALTESATKRSVREAGRIIAGALDVEDQAVSRREYETFKR